MAPADHEERDGQNDLDRPGRYGAHKHIAVTVGFAHESQGIPANDYRDRGGEEVGARFEKPQRKTLQITGSQVDS